jgi:hypothetical protein
VPKAQSAKGKAKRGRPTTFKQEVADEICDLLMQGRLLREICADPNLPEESTVRMWAARDIEGFFAQYARARDIGWDVRAEGLVDEAKKATPENYNCVRLAVDTEKWLVSKMKPRTYGDKLAVGGDEGGSPLKVVISKDDAGLM